MNTIPNIQRNVVLAPFTTYKIGGTADYFVVVADKHELAEAIRAARKDGIPYFVLGTGANILIGDKGFRGLVIKNEAKKVRIDGITVTAESGVIVADLIETTAAKAISGFEHFAGIPSTMGGAIWQNLHFLSPDRNSTVFVANIFESAEILDEEGVVSIQGKDFFKFGYDFSILHTRPVVVFEVTCKGIALSEDLIRAQIQANLAWRKEKQPQLSEFPSCGSVFKKIEGVGAGRLIEKVGLKGFSIGGAQISPQHANFIVNTGNASAVDIISLIKFVQEKVLQETGYSLETEIGFVGEF